MTTEILEQYKSAQRLAYDAALKVAGDLEEGMSERDACARLAAVLHAAGVRRYFHRPFAWFGERTAFSNFGGLTSRFFPTRRPLQRGEAVILDVAPTVDGVTVDIGYSFVFGEAFPQFVRAQQVLAEARARIPQLHDAGATTREIYRAVDELFNDAGFSNRHQRYPFRVLAHRVDTVHRASRDIHGGRFGLGAAGQLVAGHLRARLSKHPSPLWNEDPSLDGPLTPGLWAVEPHLGGDGFGAKFEELLVVTDQGARWLDDQLPHVMSTPTAA